MSDVITHSLDKTDRIPERFRVITYHSVTAGLCLLLPFPFVDEITMNHVRYKLACYLGKEQALSKAQLKLLANGESDWKKGCVRLPLTLLKKLVLWPIKRFIRKILIIFVIKDCVTEMSRTFQVGYLLDLAMNTEELPTEEGAELVLTLQLRKEIEMTLSRVNARPVRRLLSQVLLHSKSLLREAARNARCRLRREGREEQTLDPELAPEGGLTDIWNEVTQLLWHEDAFLQELKETFQQVRREASLAAAANNALPDASQ